MSVAAIVDARAAKHNEKKQFTYTELHLKRVSYIQKTQNLRDKLDPKIKEFLKRQEDFEKKKRNLQKIALKANSYTFKPQINKLSNGIIEKNRKKSKIDLSKNRAASLKKLQKENKSPLQLAKILDTRLGFNNREPSKDVRSSIEKAQQQTISFRCYLQACNSEHPKTPTSGLSDVSMGFLEKTRAELQALHDYIQGQRSVAHENYDDIKNRINSLQKQINPLNHDSNNVITYGSPKNSNVSRKLDFRASSGKANRQIEPERLDTPLLEGSEKKYNPTKTFYNPSNINQN
ncbi:hypothetical protein HYD_1940 [Candidatus Hydrogenosomobacter endosymbioticus]|uniref:Uncharacterized protein n=2 Tax=Candidatus Hydrogenosomobacter endosymbioticus TaxID=2558174 RepID=A0ABN6L6D3_9PROT|nr:hypothetical protein HYD_1940 [Candidatus Hydrogenosomobacter endosymbioticus]